MLRRSSPACVLLSLVGIWAAVGLAAESDPKKAAVTEIGAADADFQYQGEYWGSLFVPCEGCVSTGLQVVARGGGKFEALEYRGGLPGSGWDGRKPTKLKGAIENAVLILRGTSDEVLVDGRVAAFRDADGAALGQLTRIARVSPTMHASPPPDAVVLFDGSNTDQLQGAKVTADGLLEVGPLTREPVGDFRLHLEFRIPYMPYATGQARGNSGVYIQQRYEVQILDSFGLEPVENDCAALYRQQRPDVNMSLPPLSWQTYDIWFTAARWDPAGQKVANARITVLQNGVPVHWDREIPGKTGAGRPEGPEKLPILFQNHGNPVHFRNIWLVSEPCGQPGCTRAMRFPRLSRWLHRCR